MFAFWPSLSVISLPQLSFESFIHLELAPIHHRQHPPPGPPGTKHNLYIPNTFFGHNLIVTVGGCSRQGPDHGPSAAEALREAGSVRDQAAQGGSASCPPSSCEGNGGWQEMAWRSCFLCTSDMSYSMTSHAALPHCCKAQLQSRLKVFFFFFFLQQPTSIGRFSQTVLKFMNLFKVSHNHWIQRLSLPFIKMLHLTPVFRE